MLWICRLQKLVLEKLNLITHMHHAPHLHAQSSTQHSSCSCVGLLLATATTAAAATAAAANGQGRGCCGKQRHRELLKHAARLLACPFIQQWLLMQPQSQLLLLLLLLILLLK